MRSTHTCPLVFCVKEEVFDGVIVCSHSVFYIQKAKKEKKIMEAWLLKVVSSINAFLADY